MSVQQKLKYCFRMKIKWSIRIFFWSEGTQGRIFHFLSLSHRLIPLSSFFGCFFAGGCVCVCVLVFFKLVLQYYFLPTRLQYLGIHPRKTYRAATFQTQILTLTNVDCTTFSYSNLYGSWVTVVESIPKNNPEKHECAKRKWRNSHFINLKKGFEKNCIEVRKKEQQVNVSACERNN